MVWVVGIKLNIEIECENDGRWIAEVPDLSGVMTYGDTREEAVSKAEALALRVLADRLEWRIHKFTRIGAQIHTDHLFDRRLP